MSYSVEKLTDSPVILVQWYADFDPTTELGPVTMESIALLEEQPESVFYVVDLMDVDLDFGGMVRAAAEAGRGADALFHHDNIIEVVFATASALIKASAEGMDSEPYGFTKIRVFETVENALAYVNGS